MAPPYIGKIEYCYSNSTAIMLRSIDERIDPSLIEVMTGMGIGAHMSKGSGALLFDCTEPDLGISRALKNLGFSFDEASSDNPEHARFDRLRELLRQGPVVLGPLEFAKIVYNPAHVGSTDSDHYILAYDMDNEYVYVHDPWGFPCARITHADLEIAWRAEAIGYKRGYFRHWSNPKRIEQPNDDELFNRAIATCKGTYTTDEATIKKAGKLVGSDAIKTMADGLRKQPLSSWQVSFFAKFSLPLSAKRSLDYAEFFKERSNKLSGIKYEQASLFGIAGTQTAASDWSALATSLDQLAVLEDKFRERLLAD
jgi:predicted double-glycine peptidase